MESVRLIPYAEGAYPALPASCAPQATHTANEQVTLELQSTVLDPARATPQAPGTREHNTCTPSKPDVLLFGKPLSNLQTREVREDHSPRVRTPLLNFSGKSLT